MSDFYCEMEQRTVAANRAGETDAEILSHARACPVCLEILMITGMLNNEDQLAAPEVGSMPDAALIWRKSQARVREEALAKATRPIRVARVGAGIAAALGAPWLIFQILPTKLPRTPWVSPFAAFDGLRGVSLSPGFFLSVIATLACIMLSSWYVLREE